MVHFFIDMRFRELFKNMHDEDYDNKTLVRSEDSCQVDLFRWGARWDKNKNRPYFEGHEREDVIATRKEFYEYFLSNKDFYYYPVSDDEKKLNWNKPTRQMRVLLSHDESTFRSGETSLFRWFFPGFETFFNKGRGRSIMVSAFFAMHATVDVFKLDEEE